MALPRVFIVSRGVDVDGDVLNSETAVYDKYIKRPWYDSSQLIPVFNLTVQRSKRNVLKPSLVHILPRPPPVFPPTLNPRWCRLEVAQRVREMKLMTQPGVGPLAPVRAAAAAAAASLTETLSSNKLEGDAAALEHQISLLSARITSVAEHLKVKKEAALL